MYQKFILFFNMLVDILSVTKFRWKMKAFFFMLLLTLILIPLIGIFILFSFVSYGIQDEYNENENVKYKSLLKKHSANNNNSWPNYFINNMNVIW